MATIQSVNNLAAWDALFSGAAPVLIFKHSTTCPISAQAHRQFHTWAQALPAGHLQLAQVRVIEERPVSQEIARATGVRHESPQALLIQQGRVVWHASHYDITQDALMSAVAATGVFPR